MDTRSLIEHTVDSLEILEQSRLTIDSLDACLLQLHALADMWETSDIRSTDHLPPMSERISHASHLFAVSFKKVYDYIEQPQARECAYNKLSAFFEVDESMILFVISGDFHWAKSSGVLLRMALVHSSICREQMSGREHMLVAGPSWLYKVTQTFERTHHRVHPTQNSIYTLGGCYPLPEPAELEVIAKLWSPTTKVYSNIVSVMQAAKLLV